MAPPNSDDLRRTFKSMDTNGDGTLSLEELRDALKSVGQPLSNEGMRDLFESLDTNKNGAIDFEGKTRFISYNFYLTQFMSNQCPFSIPPENIEKPVALLCFRKYGDR